MKFLVSLLILLSAWIPTMAAVFPASTNGANIFTGTNTFTTKIIATNSLGGFIGNGLGLTNIQSSNVLGSDFLLKAGDTATGPILTTSATSNSPSATELATAGWVRDLFQNSGLFQYATTNISVGTNADTAGQPIYQFWQNRQVEYFTRGYTNPAAGTYVGAICTTNAFTYIQGPVSVNAYLQLVRTTGGRSVSVKPEIYFSSDRTNWFGDYTPGAQAITTGTNLYTWIVDVPATTSTNAGGYYVERRFKVTALGAGGAELIFHGGTNATILDGSHITFVGPNSAEGNAFLANNQTFTGSNMFVGPIVSTNFYSAFSGLWLDKHGKGNTLTRGGITQYWTNGFLAIPGFVAGPNTNGQSGIWFYNPTNNLYQGLIGSYMEHDQAAHQPEIILESPGSIALITSYGTWAGDGIQLGVSGGDGSDTAKHGNTVPIFVQYAVGGAGGTIQTTFADGITAWPYGHSHIFELRSAASTVGGSGGGSSRVGMIGVPATTNRVNLDGSSTSLLGEMWFYTYTPTLNGVGISADYTTYPGVLTGKMLTNGWDFLALKLTQSTTGAVFTNAVTLPGLMTTTNVAGVSVDMLKRSQYTNAAGPITFTGLANTVNGMDMQSMIRIDANGADRLITIPASWKNHDSATTFTVTNAWQAVLSIDSMIGVSTNCAWVLMK